MSMNARAHLWYGVIEKRSKIMKVADFHVPTKKLDEWEKLEVLASEFGFDEFTLQREGYEETEDHAIAAWSKLQYDFSDTRAFKMPEQGQLDEKWKKIAQKLQIKKKPRWYLWTEYC